MGEVTPIAPPPLVTAKKVAEYLSITENAVLRMARADRIPSVKVGGGGRLWRFRMEDIRKWVDQQIEESQKKMTYKPRAKKDGEQKAS